MLANRGPLNEARFIALKTAFHRRRETFDRFHFRSMHCMREKEKDNKEKKER